MTVERGSLLVPSVDKIVSPSFIQIITTTIIIIIIIITIIITIIIISNIILTFTRWCRVGFEPYGGIIIIIIMIIIIMEIHN